MSIIIDDILYINVPPLTEQELNDRLICKLTDTRYDWLFYALDKIITTAINKIKFSSEVANLEIYVNGLLLWHYDKDILYDIVNLERNELTKGDELRIFFCY